MVLIVYVKVHIKRKRYICILSGAGGRRLRICLFYSVSRLQDRMVHMVGYKLENTS